MKKLALLMFLIPAICFGQPTLENIKQHGILDIPQILAIYAKAEQGDAFSQADLGEGLINGSIGVLPNYERGYYWMKKSAEQNCALAYFNLALLYLEGIIVAPSQHEANIYVKKALKSYNENLAAHKYNKYQLALLNYKIGNLYFWGMPGSVEQDFAKALKLYESSASEGYVHAIKRVAFMYRLGLGTQRNETKAHSWDLVLAEAHAAKSQYRVGIDYLDGIGTQKNIPEGVKWIRKAALHGYYPAIEELLKLHKTGVAKLSKESARYLSNIVNDILELFRRYPDARL